MSLERGTVLVEMRLRWWNRNYVGTHFGGSLYAMCDPFFMLILIEHLGPGYVVWDKAATIRFRRPGRETLFAVFRIPAEELAAVRAAVADGGKAEREFTVDLVDAAGEVHATCTKLIHVRRREGETGPGPAP
jgi:acyl-coenzyme A thioesterase PaaI-like protein